MSLRLEGFRIRGFGPFDREFAVDLTALAPTDRLIAICGENGAGKTTALELALPGAIFRQTPTRGSLVDLATARDAFLEARVVNGASWTIRHLVDKVSGKSEALVLDAEGAPVLPDSKVRSFDAWAAQHMPAPEVFFASVFAPQGAGGFAGAKPSERKEILLGILGPETQRLEQHAAHAREQLKTAKAALAMLEARIADERTRGGDGDALTAELVQRRGAVTALTAQLERFRADLAAAEQEARNCEAAKTAAAAWEKQLNANTEQQGRAREALRGLEEKIRNNQAVLTNAAAIRAAVTRLPQLRALLEQKRAEAAVLHAAIQRHGDAQLAESRAESAAAARAASAEKRLEGAAEAEKAAASLPELRAALEKAEADFRSEEYLLEKLRAKRVTGGDGRIEALRGTLEAIAFEPVDDVPGFARERLVADDELIELAQTLPGELTALEGEVALQRRLQLAAEQAVRNAEVKAAAGAGMAGARADLNAAESEARAAGERRMAEGAAKERALFALDPLNDEIDTLEAERGQLETVAALAPRLDKAEARLAELTPQAEAAKAEIAGIDVALADMGPMPAWPGEPDLSGARQHAEGAEGALTAAHRAVAQTEQQLEQAVLSRHRLIEIDHDRTGAEAELADWTRLAADLGRDGLQAMVIDGAIPEVNDMTNDLLHAAFGPRFSVDVRTQSADAKGKRLLETLDIWVIDTGTEQHKGREGLIETFSGGEKTILAEALSLALTQLACRLSGAERPTLIRDESAGQLSEGNAPIWMAMLRRAADIINVDRILFVNHDRQTWDLADARIQVGGSGG